ncbi:uncharacterized protein LOC143243949 isoform X2 [Tachypleus tridentatus]
MWNTGFYCPEDKPNEPVYCCGTDTYKYCCTKRNLLKVKESWDDQPLIIAASLGSLLAVALVTLITCLLYRWNHIRKRRHPIVNRAALHQPSPHCPLVAGDPPPPYQLDNSYPLLFVPNHEYITIPVSSPSNTSFSRPFGSPTLARASNASDNDHLSIRNDGNADIYCSIKF